MKMFGTRLGDRTSTKQVSCWKKNALEYSSVTRQNRPNWGRLGTVTNCHLTNSIPDARKRSGEKGERTGHD